MTTAELPIDTATADDYDAVIGHFATAMLYEPRPHQNPLYRELFEPDRTLVVRDGDSIAASATAYSRTMSVPGAVIPVAHVTKVGVAATHRRRGLMARLMSRQLGDLPEPVAALWATEPGIYERFGYAIAAWRTDISAELHRIGTLPPAGAGRWRELSAEAALEVLPEIHRRYQRIRPGVSERSARRWQTELDDPADDRDGMSRRRIFVHDGADGAADGYVRWRAKTGWGPSGPSAGVIVEELVALNPDAYAALWRSVLSTDLATSLEYGRAAVGEPVRQLVGNPRALGMRQNDSLWIRITDVVRALESRRYAVPVELVIEVDDTVLPANSGRYRLTGDTNGARCARTDAAADLTMPVGRLAALYLGGVSLGESVAAGTVTAHRPELVPAASAAFGWPATPHPLEIF